MNARRFYKRAAATAENGVTLDGRPLRTPAKAVLVLPTQALAEAVAAEWQAQGEKIDPYAMPLTKLANTAIDRVRPGRARIVDEIVEYAGSDLVCYRAASPRELRARRAAAWDPVLAWAALALDARFLPVESITHRPQPREALAAARAHVAALDDFTLAALHTLTALTGSALLAAMIEREAIAADAAWAAALADEDWQIEHWGEDAEAATRRGAARREFDAACRLLSLVRSPFEL